METTTTPKIYATINAVMGELGAIEKAKRNQQQGFNYRSVDDVMNALNPLMVKHKLFCVPEVLEHQREERKTVKGGNLIYSVLKVRYTLYADDGSSISAVVMGEGMDSGDKASNKALAIAYKYAMFQIFSIPTEETAPEADQTSPPESTKVNHSQPESTKVDQRRPTSTNVDQQTGTKCTRCGQIITAHNVKGNMLDAAMIAATTYKRAGKYLCYDCYESGEY